MNKPFTTTAAINARVLELGITARDLADSADVDYTTLRYFGLLAHDEAMLERLSVALDWPPDHLRRLWDGEQTS